jgi:beta-galactosidase
LQGVQTLVLPSAKYMEANLQRKVLDFVKAGGSLLLHGRIPRYDMDGADCRILADAFEVSDFREESGWHYRYDAAIASGGFLAGGPEYHCNEYETMTVKNAAPLLRKYDGGGICAFYKEIGAGKAVVLSADYKCYLKQYEKIKAALGMRQALSHDITTPGVGVFMTLTKTLDGDEKFLYLINMDDIDKDFNVYRNGAPLFSRKIHLPANEALTLPLDVDFGFAKVVSSTAEILSHGENEIIFRNTEKFIEIHLETGLSVVPAPYISVERAGDLWILRTENRLLEEGVPIRFTGV